MLNRGGRVVLLQRSGGANILKVDLDLLSGAAVRPRTISVRYRFRQWNGHTVWCGPQSAFWADQNVYPQRRRRRANWPPDPYGEIGWFTTIARTPQSVTLEGPESPVTGLQLTKTIELTHGTVRLSVCARNIRDRAVSWDLWPNTRVDGMSRVYVPASEDDVLRVQTGHGRRAEPMAHSIVDGCFTFLPEAPVDGAVLRYGKAFLHPPRGEMAAFCGSDVLRIRFDTVARKRVHPEQALVELYNMVNRSGESLLELETHGPYRTLQPGEVMRVEQTWDLYEYAGGDSDTERIAFVKSLT